MRKATFLLLFVICLILKPSKSRRKRKPRWEHEDVHKLLELRVLETIQTHIIIAEQYIESVNDMRFMYEESPHFEMGYVIGEIIERYRKTVELAKLYARHNHTDPILTKVHRLEYTQKLYLETYHLVHMLYEIPRKYEHIPEFKNITVSAAPRQVKTFNKVWKKKPKKKNVVRKRIKKMHKDLESMFANSKQKAYANRSSPVNRQWPLDYGWEIDPGWLVW